MLEEEEEMMEEESDKATGVFDFEQELEPFDGPHVDVDDGLALISGIIPNLVLSNVVLPLIDKTRTEKIFESAHTVLKTKLNTCAAETEHSYQ